MVEVKLTLIVVRAALLHALFDREPIVTYAFEGSQDILTFSLTTHLLAKNYDRCNGMRLTSGSIVHSSRSRQDEASGPIIKPPEQTQEKLPGLLRHSPPLHGFSRLMRIKNLVSFVNFLKSWGSTSSTHRCQCRSSHRGAAYTQCYSCRKTILAS